MEKIIEEYKKVLIENYGARTVEGKCAFCGKELNGEYCDCLKATAINRFYKKANRKIQFIREFQTINVTLEEAQSKFILPLVSTPKNFEGMSFKHYLTENDSQKKVLSGVNSYYDNGIKNYLTGTNLFLFGNYGTGKTMLMSILCRALARDYLFCCRYINIVKLLSEIKDSLSFSSDRKANTIFNLYAKADFLFLDDIDKIKPTDFAKEVIYALVNYRTENELPTVVSANHSPSELDSQYFGEATISRLADISKSKVIHFSHENKRLN